MYKLFFISLSFLFSFFLSANPSFTDLPSTIRIDEGVTIVYDVGATDSNGNSINFSVSGTDSALFTIASSGRLKFKSKPDFENPTDSGKDNVYSIAVKIRSSGTTKSKDVLVKVRNIDDETPRITNFNGSVKIKENLQNVATYNIVDEDTKSSNLSLSLASNGNWPDKTKFKISGKSILFKNAPDYENPKDSDEDNIYKVIVNAKDPANNKKQYFLKVTVANQPNRNITYNLSSKKNLFIDDVTPAALCTTDYDFNGEDTQTLSPLAYGSNTYAAAVGYVGHYYVCPSGYKQNYYMWNQYDDYYVSTQKEDPALIIRLDQETDTVPCNGSFGNDDPKCDVNLYIYKRNVADTWALFDYVEDTAKSKSIQLPKDNAKYLIRVYKDGSEYAGHNNYVLHAFHRGNAPSSEQLKLSNNDNQSSNFNPRLPAAEIGRDFSSRILASSADLQIISPDRRDIVPRQILVSKKPSVRKKDLERRASLVLTNSEKQLIRFAEENILNGQDFTVAKMKDWMMTRVSEISDFESNERVILTNGYGSIENNEVYTVTDKVEINKDSSENQLLYLTIKKLTKLFPEYEFSPNFHVNTHAKFSADFEYYPRQAKYLNTISFPAGLDSAGAEVKDIYVGVIDTGGPTEGTTAWSTAAWLNKGDYDFASYNPGDGDEYDDDGTDPQACMDCDYVDYGSHGTHVGTTISAKNDGLNINGFGVNTVALRALGVGGSGYTSDICAAIAYASNQSNDSGTTFRKESGGKKISVINMSLGGGSSCGCQSIITAAHRKGVTIVASAGNSANDGYNYPASCDNVVSVSATNAQGTRSYYSTYNEAVDLASPGGDLYLDYAGEPDGVYAFSKDDRMEYYQGTSMAAPVAAGVIANIYAKNSNATSKFVHDLLKKDLLTTDVGIEGKDIYYGHGLINFERAMEFAGKDLSAVSTTIATPSYVNMSSSSSKLFNISKSGTGSLKIQSVNIDTPGLKVARSSVNSNGFGSYKITKDASKFSFNDRFISSIDVVVKNGFTTWTEKIPLYFQVGKNGQLGRSSDLSFINLTNTVKDSSATHNLDMTFRDSLKKKLVVEAGTYEMCASTDLDNDGVFCEFGEISYKFNNMRITTNGSLSMTLSPNFSN